MIHTLSEMDSYPGGLVIYEHTPTPVPLKLYYHCDACGTRSREFWTGSEHERLVSMHMQGLMQAGFRAYPAFVILRSRRARKRFGLKSITHWCRPCFNSRQSNLKARGMMSLVKGGQH